MCRTTQLIYLQNNKNGSGGQHRTTQHGDPVDNTSYIICRRTQIYPIDNTTRTSAKTTQHIYLVGTQITKIPQNITNTEILQNKHVHVDPVEQSEYVDPVEYYHMKKNITLYNYQLYFYHAKLMKTYKSRRYSRTERS